MSLIDWPKLCLSTLKQAPCHLKKRQVFIYHLMTCVIVSGGIIHGGCERGSNARVTLTIPQEVKRQTSPSLDHELSSKTDSKIIDLKTSLLELNEHGDLNLKTLDAPIESPFIASADIIPGHTALTQLAARAQGARWSDLHTLRMGPIPDYAPIRAVYFHQQLSGLAPESALALEVFLSGLYEIDDYDPGELDGDVVIEDTMLLWMRDYHPIYVRDPTGALRAIHYLAHNPNRARYLLRGAPRVDELDQLPLIHENGNLIVAGQWVFVSERLLEDNQDGENEDHLIEGGYLPRGRSELIAMLSDKLHVPKNRVVMLPNMPHEATGHVDLYLMAINDHQVIIPKIVIPLDHFTEQPIERQIAEDVKQFLDDRAQQIAQLGLEVIRLPQLPPLRLPALDEPEGNYDVVFYTPTNGLLVNKGKEQIVLLPHFEAEGLRPDLAEMTLAYERFWQETFTTLGWPAYMIESTHLGRYLGLIHCVTATTPLLPLREEWRKKNHLPSFSIVQKPVLTRVAEVSASRYHVLPKQSSSFVTQTLKPVDGAQHKLIKPLPHENKLNTQIP